MAETDPRVAAARREVLAARGDLVDQVSRLETRARATADVKAQLKRSPEKAAAVAAGLGFLAFGGPKKVLKGAKRAVFGRGKPYPSRLLPDEIEAVVSRLGDDGEKVRGTLEREFATFLKDRKKQDKGALRSVLVGSILMPLASAAIKGAAKRAAAGEPILPSGGGAWGGAYETGKGKGKGAGKKG